MNSAKKEADLTVSLGLHPLRGWLWPLQKLKLAPILVGESYRLTVEAENLHSYPLEDLRLRVSQLIRIGTENVRSEENVPVGHLAARDKKTDLRSASSHLMHVIGPNDMKIEEALAGNKPLTMKFQGRADTTFLSVYNVESWNVLWLRLSAVIVNLSSLVMVLKFLLGR